MKKVILMTVLAVVTAGVVHANGTSGSSPLGARGQVGGIGSGKGTPVA
jgi:hypothetical protein